MSRKGIILAGGAGTRLHPLTMVTSKQLLPVYDKPMIYYPLSALMLAGIRDILIITTPQAQATFKHLLGTGKQWGIKLEYAASRRSPTVWRRPSSSARILCAAISRVSSSAITSCTDMGCPMRCAALVRARRALLFFSYWVEDPQRYGVIEFGAGDEVLSIDEKPQNPKSNWAAIGRLFLRRTGDRVGQGTQTLAAWRMEITDLNILYMRERRLKVERLGRGFAWFDAGTHDSLLEAAEFVRVLQRRQGQLVCSPDEIAFHNGWVDAEQLKDLAAKAGKTLYAQRLLENLR